MEPMTLFYVMIWGFAGICGVTAVSGLVWAVRTGQLANFGRGATSIFDEDEPLGEMTDRFPGSGLPRGGR
jgi:nitrogen fixation-related uncharacterized protein